MYMAIHDNKDLRRAYEMLNMINKLIREYGFSNIKNPDGAKENIKEIKAAIRKYNKKPSGNRLVKDYGCDGFIELVELPDFLEDEKEADAYFDENERIGYRPSMYDCTGQLFTSWWKVFIRNGHWMAYHRVAVDC